MFVHKTNEMKIPVKIWLNSKEEVEESALEQIENICSAPYIKAVSIMPDVHTGYGCPIGSVVATENVLIPSVVGVDIGCGMCLMELEGINKNDLHYSGYESLVNKIKHKIPMGFNRRNIDIKNQRRFDKNEIIERAIVHNELGLISDWYGYLKQLLKGTKFGDKFERRFKEIHNYSGTLGGGNHFIEFQYDASDNLYVMLHSGSRGVGEIIALAFQNEAIALNKKWYSNNVKGVEFLYENSIEGMLYLEAVRWAQEFAYLNRLIMMEEIKMILTSLIPNIKFKDIINIHHNYVQRENHFGKNLWVHRKGATRVRDNIIGLIPGSMGSPSYVVRGTNDIQSMNSCSHGAGRKMSRKKAKDTVSLQDFNNAMEGIYSNDINEQHLDESPLAYKDIKDVMFQQTDLVEVERTLHPILNVKG